MGDLLLRVACRESISSWKFRWERKRTLRSSSQLLLCQPATKISFQSKAFSIMAPAVWSSLSPLSSCEKFRYHHHLNLSRNFWNCSLLHTVRFNFPSAAGVSDSKSRRTTTPKNVLTLALTSSTGVLLDGEHCNCYRGVCYTSQITNKITKSPPNSQPIAVHRSFISIRVVPNQLHWNLLPHEIRPVALLISLST